MLFAANIRAVPTYHALDCGLAPIQCMQTTALRFSLRMKHRPARLQPWRFSCQGEKSKHAMYSLSKAMYCRSVGIASGYLPLLHGTRVSAEALTLVDRNCMGPE